VLNGRPSRKYAAIDFPTSPDKGNSLYVPPLLLTSTVPLGQHYYLYMIEDTYSRKVVGWKVHHNETCEQAAELLERSVWAEKCLKQT